MPTLSPALQDHLRRGVVIPAHPLALTTDHKLDERSQTALTRYYCAAGAGGIAVGVHTTQFEIHAPATGLLAPVLALAAETADAALAASPGSPLGPFIKIAGLVGPTRQAVAEAQLALDYGYHAGLLSLAALRSADDDELLAHVRTVAEVIPVFGFYLQPAVGGRHLSYAFWRRFAEIDNVVAVKIAPFNRYQTLDVVRGVADAGRAQDIALYTGNDDNIVADLITDFAVGREPPGRGDPPLQIVGGLLGQWAVWTRRAVETLAAIRAQRAADQLDYRHWLAYNSQLTDANAAVFDVTHDFCGCIPGIHWVLRRQGLMQTVDTLNPAERLSPGQVAALERVYAVYPHLTDDDFIAAHRDAWLR